MELGTLSIRSSMVLGKSHSVELFFATLVLVSLASHTQAQVSFTPDCSNAYRGLAVFSKQAQRHIDFHNVLEKTAHWQELVRPLQAATDLRLKQALDVRVLNSNGSFSSISAKSADYAHTAFLIAKVPPQTIPEGATVYKRVHFGYKIQDEFRKLASLNYLMMDRKGNILEIGGGSAEVIDELKSHIFGRRLSPEDYQSIETINSKLISELRANPVAQKKLAEFAKKRGWPEGLEDKAGLAYFDESILPLKQWARNNNYTLEQLRDAGWMRLTFDDSGKAIYRANGNDSIKIPFFNDANQSRVPIWRTRVLKPKTPDSPKYLGWPLNRSILRPQNINEKLYFAWALEEAKDQTLVITEGEFKCLVARHTSGIHTVGLPGITEWDEATIKALVDAKAKNYVVILDRDPKGKALMRVDEITDSSRAAYTIARELEKAGASSVRIGILPDVFDGGKVGIDDMILAKGPDSYKQVVDSAISTEDYAKRLSLDTTFHELTLRRQRVKKSIDQYTLSANRGGKTVEADDLEIAIRAYEDLDAGYKSYLNQKFNGAKSIDQPSSTHNALTKVSEMADESKKVIKLQNGERLPAKLFTGDILLLDYLPQDQNPSICLPIPCFLLPYDLSDLKKAFASASNTQQVELNRDLSKGNLIAQKSNFKANSIDDYASIVLAGRLSQTFPADEYRFEFNVSFRTSLGHDALSEADTIPVVVFRKSSNAAVAMGQLRSSESMTPTTTVPQKMQNIRNYLRPAPANIN